MKASAFKTLTFIALTALWASSAAIADSVSLAPEVAAIVHPNVEIDELSLAELRRVLLGDRQFWSGGLRVTLLIRAPVAIERDVILKHVYRMSEAQFRKYWIGKIFRAEATAGPKIVFSTEMVSRLISVIPGSISFVDAAQVPADAKVLRIDGYLPGEEGYPLSKISP